MQEIGKANIIMSVQLSIMQPQVQVNNHSVAEVQAQIEVIVTWARRVGSPMGYFAIWLGRLIEQIDTERNWQRFEQPELIDTINLLLANRYFDALNLYLEADGEAPLCWQAAFTATQQSEFTVFQHLVMGTNAVVQYDLPLALSTTLDKFPAEQTQSDLSVILSLIEDNLRKTQSRFAQQSRIFRMMDAFGRSHNHWFDLLDLAGHTEPTWEFAQGLSTLRGQEFRQQAAKVDQLAMVASREIMASAHRVLRRWFAQVSRWENQPVPEIIDWLRTLD